MPSYIDSTMEFKPVYDSKDGHVVLYDMYRKGVWHGSRSTLAQAQAFMNWLYPDPPGTT